MNRERFIDGNKTILNTDFYLYLLSCENENTNSKQALNEIKRIITTCKKLMPHEFDWEEQADNILEKIDKVGGNE